MAKVKSEKVITKALEIELQMLELQIKKYKDGLIYDDLNQQISEIKMKLVVDKI